MDAEYNQYEIEADCRSDALNYLEDGMACEAVFYNNKAISVDLPSSVVREVVYTEPAVKGDTSGKVMKPARLATGFELPVPAFVEKMCIRDSTANHRQIDAQRARFLNGDDDVDIAAPAALHVLLFLYLPQGLYLIAADRRLFES